jgi:hypothetical protein
MLRSLPASFIERKTIHFVMQCSFLHPFLFLTHSLRFEENHGKNGTESDSRFSSPLITLYSLKREPFSSFPFSLFQLLRKEKEVTLSKQGSIGDETHQKEQK